MREQAHAIMHTLPLAYAWDRSHSPGAQSFSGCGRAPLGKPEGGSASHSDSRRAWNWAPLKEIQLWGLIHSCSTLDVPTKPELTKCNNVSAAAVYSSDF